MQEKPFHETFEGKVNGLVNSVNTTFVHNHVGCKADSFVQPHKDHTSCRYGIPGYQPATFQDYENMATRMTDFIKTLDVSTPEHAKALDGIISAAELPIQPGTPAERQQQVLKFDYESWVTKKPMYTVDPVASIPNQKDLEAELKLPRLSHSEWRKKYSPEKTKEHIAVPPKEPQPGNETHWYMTNGGLLASVALLGAIAGGLIVNMYKNRNSARR